ncbi:helix-turn-helix domain-containing protein [Oceanobacillus sp. CFH 90083]|uniref:AraC family transcriptional regulator n=1 Tax=Oceanobacillus sp. CFH 90083 TaxID=2592336 RepID=UPI00128B934D|nr:helix-turn-helix domain-containing protein [Oceanobacillus sp. CFH 90083]
MKNLFEGKKDLNKYVTSVSLYGAEFRIYYWGGWERYFGTKEHVHSFFEMTYVLNGTGEYHEGNVCYPLAPHSLILSRPNYEHQLFSEHGMKTLYFAFDLKESESDDEWRHYIQCLKQKLNPVFPSPKENIYSNLWKALYQSAIEMEHTKKAKMLKQLAPQLLIATFDCFYPLPKQESLITDQSLDEHKELIYRVNLYIKDNLHKNIKISDIADDLYVSKRHLSRLMREETGKTFTEVLQDERLSLATEYLRTTDKSVKNIAIECGFLDVSYFTKLFTRTMRYPPTKYRKMYQDTMESEFKDR